MDPVTLALLISLGAIGTATGTGAIVKLIRLRRSRRQTKQQQQTAQERYEELQRRQREEALRREDEARAQRARAEQRRREEAERRRQEEEQRRAEEAARQAAEQAKSEPEPEPEPDIADGGKEAWERDKKAVEQARQEKLDWLKEAANKARREPMFRCPLPLPGSDFGLIGTDEASAEGADKEGTGDGEGDSDASEAAFGPDGKINYKRLSEKASFLVKLLEHMNRRGDQVLVEAMARHLGVPLSVLETPYTYVRLAEKLAERIDVLLLKVFDIASNERELVIEHARDTEFVERAFPADEVRLEQYRNAADIPRVIAEHQILLPNDLYYTLLCARQLLVQRDYEEITHGQILMLLLDMSGSMQEEDKRGLPRWVWASGVTLGLLNKAIIEKSTYFLRYFTGDVSSLRRATNQAEAVALAEEVIKKVSVKFDGGTDISQAVSCAIEDIETEPDCQFAHILLISDGECGVNAGELKERLGEKITLNAAMIAVKENPELKAACATYLEI